MTSLVPSDLSADDYGLPPVAELPIAASPARDSSPASEVTSRRSMLKTGALASAAVAFGNALAFTVGSRPVSAELPPYETHPTHNYYGSGAGSGCLSDVGCTGAPPDRIDQGYCATASDWSANPSTNWHRYYFTGTRGSYTMWDSQDICGGAYDAWNHTGAPCGFCPTQIHYRCHDGYKKYQSNQAQLTICHGISKCEGQPKGGNCGSSC